jgi:hypothetical protein
VNRILLASACLLAALIGGLYFARDLGADSSGVEPAAPSALPEANAGEPASSQHDSTLVSEDSEARSAVLSQLAPSVPTTKSLQGTVVVLDGAGVVHPSENGTIVWEVRMAGRRFYERSTVEEGRFHLALSAPATIAAKQLVFAGKQADLEVPTEPLAVPADQPVTLQARWLAGTPLHVLDLATRAELDEVTVLRGSYPDPYFAPSGELKPQDVVFDSVPSPVELPRTETEEVERTYYVTSPGYAWSRLTLSSSDSGERELLLEPGGDLEVELTGAEPPHRARLNVFRAGALVTMLELNGRRTVQLARLPAGELELRAILRGSGGEPIPLASALARVEPGATSRVQLELPLLEQPSLVDLAGVVVVPEAWNSSGFQLLFKRHGGSMGPARSLSSEQMERDAARPERFHWRLKDIPAGCYQLLLRPPGLTLDVEVLPPGREDVVIELPPPVRMQLQVVDAVTEEPVRVNDVTYFIQAARILDPADAENIARLDEATGLFNLQAPLGVALEFKVIDSRYRGTQILERVEAGVTKLQLRARRFHLVELRLECEGSAVDWPRGVRSSARLASGGEEQELVAWTSPAYLAVETPGAWIVEVPEIPGYATLPPQTVEVAEGSEGRCVFQLSAKH